MKIDSPYSPLRITSPFGMRTGANLPTGATLRHDGIDIGRDVSKYSNAYSDRPSGAVTAALAGTVTDSGYKRGRGYTVIIDHGIIEGVRVKTLYQHLHKDGLAQVGSRVRVGERIGYMGRSGMGADMPVHLHFELHLDGKVTDPVPFIKGDVPLKPTAKEDKELKVRTKINLNGREKVVDAIHIDGQNFVKLRDLADEQIEISYERHMPTIRVKSQAQGAKK